MRCYEVLVSAGNPARLISKKVYAENISKAINTALERVAFDWPTLTPIRPTCIDTQAGGAFRWNEPVPRPEWEPIYRFCVECLSPVYKEKLAEFHVWATCADEAINHVRKEIRLSNIKFRVEESYESDA